MRLNEMRDRAYQNAVIKGWWPGDRSAHEMQMLMVSEIAEATEEVRSNRPSVWFASHREPTTIEAGLLRAASGVKPEGEAIEIGDLLIRIGDYFGHRGWDLEAACGRYVYFHSFKVNDMVSSLKNLFLSMREKNPLECHYMLVKGVTNAFEHSGTSEEPVHLAGAAVRAMAYFEIKGWDLEQVLTLKLTYNETRPDRHGGKLY